MSGNTMKFQLNVAYKTVRSLVLLALLLAGFCLQIVNAVQTENTATPDSWQLVNEGRAIVIMRHALAPGMGDPVEFNIDQCQTQRNLSDVGRQQAKNIGDVLRENGVGEAEILSSQWCRCIETAELLDFGEPVEFPVINSFFQDRSTEPAQTSALVERIEDWINDGANKIRVLVSHQVNISALTGTYANSGDMLIVTIQDNEIVVLDQIQTQ